MSYNVFCFFNDTATTEIYTLSLHDALPILVSGRTLSSREVWLVQSPRGIESRGGSGSRVVELSGDDLTIEDRSEEHTSELQSRQYIVCCLLLENKYLISRLFAVH